MNELFIVENNVLAFIAILFGSADWLIVESRASYRLTTVMQAVK